MKIRPVGAELFHDETNNPFSQFCERAWKENELPETATNSFTPVRQHAKYTYP